MKQRHRAALVCLATAAAVATGCGSDKPVESKGPSDSSRISTKPAANAPDRIESVVDGAKESPVVEAPLQPPTADVMARTPSENADSSSSAIFLPEADADAPGPELPGLPLRIGAKPKSAVSQ